MCGKRWTSRRPYWSTSSQINPYVLDLYFTSVDGELVEGYFDNLLEGRFSAAHEEPYFGLEYWIASDIPESGVAWDDAPLPPDAFASLHAITTYARTRPVSTPEEVQTLLTELVTVGRVQLSDDPQDILDLKWAMEDIQHVSLALCMAHPDVFVPYGFKALDRAGQHQELLQIAGAFDIALPNVAAKNDVLNRWLYLGHYSAAMQEFRARNHLTMPQLLAFFYNFGPVYVRLQPRDELPAPRHAWLLVGGGEQDGDYGVLEDMVPEDVTHWQGSLDMQRGDVCVMYLRTPVKGGSFPGARD